MSFTGVYQHAIDAKGRTSLPSRFREVLSAQGADKLFVTTDVSDLCLQAFAPAQWEAFIQKVASRSQFDQRIRLVMRTFVAPAQECPVDKLGRILLPPALRDYAGLDGEITWAGNVERIEVWSPERWADTQAAARSPESQKLLLASLHELL